MITVTVKKNGNKATFNWSDDCKECDYNAHGFEESEIDAIIESKAHEGVQVNGYEVEITM